MPKGSMSFATSAEGSAAHKRLKNTAVEKEVFQQEFPI